MHTQALTISTGQVESWGLVGICLVVLGAALVFRLVRGLLGRTIWTVVALGLIFLMWQQHTSIGNSIKACSPNVLGVHLVISDRQQLTHCRAALNPKR
jgi:hypothetical protein